MVDEYPDDWFDRLWEHLFGKEGILRQVNEDEDNEV